MDSSSAARHLLAGLLAQCEAALRTFIFPYFKDVTKSIRVELRSVSGVFVGIGNPNLFGHFHVMILSCAQEFS
jgi:hypothetical protein